MLELILILSEMSKSDLLTRSPAELIPDNIDIDDLMVFTTSGSTGQPLAVRATRRDAAVNQALMLRVLQHHGMKPWHSKLSVRGTPQKKRNRSWLGHLGLFRRGEISATLSPEDWVTELIAFKPDYIIGYCLTLRMMAKALKSADVKGVKPRCVLSTSGILEETTRHEIAEGFSAPVFDVYASWEGGMMAWECRHCGAYHVNSDQVIIEILKNGKPVAPGEEGEAVITNLHSYGMPIIRYRQGDLVVRGADLGCRCRLPTLSSIHGRTADMLLLPDGREMSPHGALALMDKIPGIERWRIVQPHISKLCVEIVAGADFDKAASHRVYTGLRDLIGEDIEIIIKTVDDLPFDPNSKFRLVEHSLSAGGGSR